MEISLIRIKNDYAQEQGFQNWEELQSDCYGYSEDMEDHMDEICIRAQKAALEKAAENALLNVCDNKIITIYRPSITNEENLIR